MKKDYGGVIWTNHALERMQERGIIQGDAFFTFNKPDQTRYADSKGAWVYYRTYKYEDKGRTNYQKIEVVATQNERKEWIIISVWARPVSAGEYKDRMSLLSRLLKLVRK